MLPALLLGEDVVDVDSVLLVNAHGDDAADVAASPLPHPELLARPCVLHNSSSSTLLQEENENPMFFKKLIKPFA